MSSPLESFAADRRRFLRLAGLAGLTSLGAPALAFAQSKPPAGATPPASAGTPAPAPPDTAGKPPAPENPPEISEDARALASVIRRRYGQHLTPDQLEAVTREIDGRIQGGRRLRDLEFANGDEPDFTFGA
jgi:hypothetical protein